MIDERADTDADAVASVEALRLGLLAKVWPMAVEAGRTQEHEAVRELVKLKVDIEAIDFALAHRPGHVPT